MRLKLFVLKTVRFGLVRDINENEVRNDTNKIGPRKAVVPDKLPVEVWTPLGENGVKWIVDFFNSLIKEGKMPDI